MSENENSVSRQLAVDARALVEDLKAELNNTQTRDQYIRLNVLIMQADRLATLAETGEVANAA